MQHNEASTQIFFTSDYARFNMINGNRQLNELKIKKIIAEINHGNDMLRYYPIQVKENKERLDILDGQHRFWISKKLSRPVFYILVKEEKSMPDIAKINSNVEKWKPEDFINCYVQHGNSNYQIIREFQDKYQMSLSVTLKLLHYGGVSNPGGLHENLGDDFRNGKYEVKAYAKATEIAEDCKLFSSFPKWQSTAFVIAINRIKEANLISITDLLSTYNKCPEMLTKQDNFKSYINTLEQMVNVGKHKRIIIV